MMNRGITILLLIFVLLFASILITCDRSDESTPISIPDKILRQAMIRSLAEELGDKRITVEALSKITKLDIRCELSWFGPSECMRDFSGIQYCINLTSLIIEISEISDLSPLSSLTNLTSLDLSNNEISDLSPLSFLTNLTSLDTTILPHQSDFTRPWL
jgi:Leucine-rich repeat (LRR) protein